MAFPRHIHAHNMGFIVGQSLLNLILFQVLAMAVVANGLFLFHLGFTQLVEALASAEAPKGVTAYLNS